MNEYDSTVYGFIEYSIIDEEKQVAIANFIGNIKTLDEYMQKKYNRAVHYSLPHAYVNSVGIEFNHLTGNFLDVKESLEVVITFLKALDVKGLKLDVIKFSNSSDLNEIDIRHFKLDKNEYVVSSPATITFRDYC